MVEVHAWENIIILGIEICHTMSAFSFYVYFIIPTVYLSNLIGELISLSRILLHFNL